MNIKCEKSITIKFENENEIKRLRMVAKSVKEHLEAIRVNNPKNSMINVDGETEDESLLRDFCEILIDAGA